MTSADIMVISGSLILLCSLYPVSKTHRQLPAGSVKRAWQALSFLIFVFFCGYNAYAFIFWNTHTELIDFVVPAIFLLGATFVFGVCTLMSVTSSNVRKVSRLEIESITDPLMNIYNRRYFDRCLLQEAAKARRHGVHMSLLVIDIDDFKQINDTHGHQVGDKVLKAFAKTIQGSLRDFDLVFRYGGEEVVIILPFTGHDGAGVIAERLRNWVESRTMVKADSKKLYSDILVTISIGVSTFHPNNEHIENAIYRADSALYTAKTQGKNRVVVAQCPDNINTKET